MASLTLHRIGLLERLESPISRDAPVHNKGNDQSSAHTPLDMTASTTPSSMSEPDAELLELYCGPPTVSGIESHSVTFSWAPLHKVPQGLSPVYAIELQQLESVDSSPNTNWLSVYKGNALSCQVNELKSGRRYAVRLVAGIDSANFTEDSTDGANTEVRVNNAQHVCFDTPATVPSAMQPPSLAQRARNALKLKWNAPEDPGGPFELSYVLQISPAPLMAENQGVPTGFVEVYRGPERSFKVTKLQPGVRYTSRVQAVNLIGEGPFSLVSAYTTQATVPAAPDSPEVQAAFSSALTLSWRPPADNGSPIIGYTLERDDGPGSEFLHAYAGPNTSDTIKALRPGVKYRFRLRAENDEGRSIWSPTVTFTTGAAPPGSPQGLKVQDTPLQTTAKISWRAPDEDGGSAVTAYVVELQAKSRAAIAFMGSDWLKIFQGEAIACHIASLRPGCSYRVRVRARNSAGWGQWALPVDLNTAQDVPDVPQSLQRDSCTATTAVVTWAAPDHDGGSQVQNYELQMATDDCHCGCCPQALVASQQASAQHLLPQHGLQYHGTPGAPAPAVGVSGASAVPMRTAPCSNQHPMQVYLGLSTGAELRPLQPGSHYFFRVRAVNSIGRSNWTEWLPISTKPDVPIAPGPLMLTGIAATTIFLSWQMPHGRGSPVTHYTVEAAMLPQFLHGSPPGPVIVPDSVAKALSFKLAYCGPLMGCEVRGLEPYTAYAFRLCAHNEVGPSAWGPCTAAITGHAPPTCPVSVSAQAASSHKIVLCWAPPERDFGAAVVSYTVDMAPRHANASSRQAGAGGGGGSSNSCVSWSNIYTGSGCAYTAEGLAPGRSYQFRVRASNLCGCGPYAPVVSAKTLPAPPAAPGKPVVSARTASGFRVRWDDPDQTHGAPVTAYVLESMAANAEEWCVLYTGTEVSVKISGLQPCTKYILRVAAANVAGQGNYSESEAVTTTLLPPQPPTDVSITEGTFAASGPTSDIATVSEVATPPTEAAVGTAGGVSAVVAWREPAASSQHAAVMAYEVVATPRPGSDQGVSGGGVMKLTVGARGACDGRLDGLLPGCTYGIKVRCVGVDGAGHSSWSDEVSITTPARPDSDTMSACSSGGGAGVSSINASSMVQRKAGGKKAAKRQQAVAASASAGALAALANDDASASRARGKASGATSRVTAAVTTVAAKKLRRATTLERLVDDTSPVVGKVVETVAVCLFGSNWRRDHVRMLKSFGKSLLIVVCVALLVLCLWSWSRPGRLD